MAATRARGRADRDLPEPESRSDAYTGMLIISLVATLTGLVFCYLDYSDYSTKPPPISSVVAPAAPAK
jgi:hypothetical protein